MARFFVLPEKVSGDEIMIDTEDVSHISRVLRLQVGDEIEICDTCGYDYHSRIEEIQKNAVRCRVLSKAKSDSEPALKVTLYQGLPKGSKMDYIIQKTTELGITRIVPCEMSRCVVKLEDRKEKKTERWRKIAEEAAKQSGRGIIPEISMPMTFHEALEDMKNAEILFAPYECEEDQTLRSVISRRKEGRTAAFIIGPEGGFDPAEIEAIQKCGIPAVTLGKRILRTETAGEAVLAMIMYEFEQ